MSQISLAMLLNTILRSGGSTPPPATPTGLAATVISTARIDLAWTDAATNETEYRVYRSTDNVTFSLIDTIAANSTSYSDTTITSGTTYYYKVAAYNAGGESLSDALTLTTPESGPLLVDIGQFTLTTGTAGTTLNVVTGFEPKLVLLSWNRAVGTANPDPAVAVDAVASFGAFTSPSNRYAAQSYARHSPTTMQTNRVQSNDCCVIVTNNVPAVAGMADVNAITPTGFQLIIDQAFASAVKVHYIALGGDDLDIALGTLDLGVGTGTLNVTGLGFQPNAVLFFGAGQTTIDNTPIADSILTVGAADGTTQWVFTGGTNNNTATSTTSAYGYEGECIAFPNNALSALETRCTLVSMLADGFQLNRVENGVASKIVVYAALSLADIHVGTLLTQTNTTTPIVESGFGFSPIATLLASHNSPQNTVDTVSNPFEFAVGMFTSPTDRLAMSARDNHNSATAVNGVLASDVYAYVKQNANANTGSNTSPLSVDAAMDVQSIDLDGFTLIMDDAAPAQALVGYISFGAPDPVVVP